MARIAISISAIVMLDNDVAKLTVETNVLAVGERFSS